MSKRLLSVVFFLLSISMVAVSTIPLDPVLAAGQPAPIITGVAATNITSSGATIVWTTNVASTSVVDYGTSTRYGQTRSDASLVTNHVVSLSGLAGGTTYFYRVKSKASGKTATASGFTFTTQASPPPPPPSPAITVNPTQTFQIMNGWEATTQAGALNESETANGQSNVNPNFALYKDSLYDQAASDGINRLRLELRSGMENPVDYFTQYVNGQIPFSTYRAHWYDSVNDNAFDTTAEPLGFQFSELDFNIQNYILPLKQRLEARGEQLFLNMTYVDFGNASFEHYANPSEYAEFILAAYQHMQSVYGFVPDTLEIILEPDNTPFNGTYIGQAMLATATRLSAAGFMPKFILPSTTNMNNAPIYFDEAKAVVGDAFISQYVEEIAYHLYGGFNPTTAAGLASRAAQYGVKTSQLEFIGADVNDLIADLTQANVSGWQQYAMAFPGGFDDGSIYYVVNGTTVTPGNITKQLRQYFKYVRRGAVRIGVVSSNGNYEPVAFRNVDSKHVLIVKSALASTFSVAGMTAGTYGVVYTVNGTTTNGSDIVLLDGQNLSATLPGAGIITFYQK